MEGVQVLESPSYYGQVMPMNVTRGPLKDVRVRKAIALAFDYQAMVDFYQGFAEPSNGPLPTGFSANIAARPRYERNVEEAKKLLAEAGYAKGFELEYIGLKGLSYFEFAGTLIEQNLKELGITVKQTLIPWPEMAASYSKRDTAGDITFLNMSAFTNDAGAYLGQSYLSTNAGDKGGYNWSFYENKELDAKINGLSQIADEGERMTATEALNAEIADLYLSIYVTQPKLAQPVKAGWTGYYDSLDANYSVRFFYTRYNG
jgi:peptide/nickel transport system substrate-binding protein